MVCKINSMGIFGMNTYTVDVEVDFLKALPGFDVVGLPDTAIKESRDRVRYAIKNSGYKFPDAKITVNLAPAELKKSGAVYDVPICLGILSVSGQIDFNLKDCAFIGQLSFSGDVRGISGVLPMVIHAKDSGIKKVYVPFENLNEASVVKDIEVYGVKHINELIRALKGELNLPTRKSTDNDNSSTQELLDFCDVKGQVLAKRALEIAAAGGHNALMIGAPGSGKSMLAKRLPSILPDMTFEESIETTKIYSIAGVLQEGDNLITKRPFRSPHHTVSPAGLSGGGTIPKPGEISLAHNGVLFLDELPEFSRNSMEILRQPIEDDKVTISRVNGTLSYPCSIMLIAAMNPCPCGYFGHPTKECTCSQNQVTKYLSKVSGPLLDRLDLHIDVMPVEFSQISSTQKEESSSKIKERVNKARQIQNKRFEGTNITCNAKITSAKLNEYCVLNDDAKQLLKNAFDKLSLSARAYDRIVKVARTIADLDESEDIKSNHIAEAIQYRSLDRKYWLR